MLPVRGMPLLPVRAPLLNNGPEGHALQELWAIRHLKMEAQPVALGDVLQRPDDAWRIGLGPPLMANPALLIPLDDQPRGIAAQDFNDGLSDCPWRHVEDRSVGAPDRATELEGRDAAPDITRIDGHETGGIFPQCQ